MAGIAIVLDLIRKNQAVCTQQFSAAAAVSAAACSFAAATTPFSSRRLLGSPKVTVAYCDAGATVSDDTFSDKQRVPVDIFPHESLKYVQKEYYIELKPLFSAFHWKQLALTSLRAFLLYYLPLVEPRPPREEEEDDEDFLEEKQEGQRVDLVVPFRKSVKQIIRETTVVTTRRILERLAIHYVSQRMAWKLLKDVSKSAKRKAGRELPTTVFFFRVSRTTFRGHLLASTAQWLIQVGIDTYQFIASLLKSEEEFVRVDRSKEIKVLGKKVAATTVKCTSSLVFASVGAGIGATLIRPSLGQWLGCAAGDLAGPIIVAVCFQKFLDIEL